MAHRRSGTREGTGTAVIQYGFTLLVLAAAVILLAKVILGTSGGYFTGVSQIMDDAIPSPTETINR